MVKTIFKKWSNLRIGTRLLIGVATTLTLTLLVGIVGLGTIKYQIHSQKLANQSIDLLNVFNEARKDEKNFMLIQTKEYAKKTLGHIARLQKKSKTLKKSLSGENQKLITTLNNEVKKYKKEFESFVNFNAKKTIALNVMVVQGRALENTAVILRDDQKKELQSLENKAVFSSDQRQEKSEKADDANRIIKLMSEARREEKNFLLRNHKRYADEARNFVNKLITQANATKERFSDKENQTLADLILQTAKKYLQELKIVVIGKEKSIAVHQGMIKLGREVEEKSIELRKDQKDELVALEKARESKLTPVQTALLLDKRKKVDITNQIIKLMAEARQQEKNFLLRKEQSYAEVTVSLVNQMIKELTGLQNTFKNKQNQALVNSIIKVGNKYLQEFEKLVTLTYENNHSQDIMASLGREVEDRAAQLRSDQKQELTRLEKLSTAYSKQRLDKRIKADTANRIIKFMAEARQQEKNFLLRHENAYAQITRNLVTQAVREVHALKATFEDKQNRLLIDKITQAAQIYLREFESVVIANKEQTMQQKRMIVAARAIEKIAKTVKENTQIEAQQVQGAAIVTIFMALLLALIVGIVAIIVLTRSIANPIGELVNVINKLAQEDDVDVPLVHQKDEIGQIARAIADFKEVLLRRKEKTEAQLIQSEKMAALGDLVAGVAHEINTPIGIAVTGSTHLQNQIKNLEISFESGKLRKAEFRAFVENALPTADTIESNLERASSLIKSFKQVAVDQSSQEVRSIVLYEYITDIITSLHPKLKQYQHHVTIKGDKKIHIETIPGALSQVITNLIMNSLIHAYDDKNIQGNLLINLSQIADMTHIVYSDDGKGMDEKTIKRIFEPFYTTKRGSGGSGLGLSIVYNLVTQTLGGSIHCHSELTQGSIFEIIFPSKHIHK